MGLSEWVGGWVAITTNSTNVDYLSIFQQLSSEWHTKINLNTLPQGYAENLNSPLPFPREMPRSSADSGPVVAANQGTVCPPPVPPSPVTSSPVQKTTVVVPKKGTGVDLS